MKGVLTLVLMLAFASSAFSQTRGNDEYYKLGPDSLPQEGVPKGIVNGPFTLPSEVFPGTTHTYWVYVPAQYDKAKPAHLMIFNDGHAYMKMDASVRVPNVLDNLIYRRELPVMIAVFINPGRRPDQPEPAGSEWGDRNTNRPTEYNVVDDKYPRVICEELLPAPTKEYNISTNPEHRGIGGTSSGGIAAFNVAWQRPNEFRKVFTIVGSFVNLRGGHVFPDLVKEADKKPLRVFLVDGRNDNRGQGRGGRGYSPERDWFYQNVRLANALTEKGYELNYIWGIGLHGHQQGGAVFPEVMRWLWRDHGVSTDVNDVVERSYHGAVAAAGAAE